MKIKLTSLVLVLMVAALAACSKNDDSLGDAAVVNSGDAVEEAVIEEAVEEAAEEAVKKLLKKPLKKLLKKPLKKLLKKPLKKALKKPLKKLKVPASKLFCPGGSRVNWLQPLFRGWGQPEKMELA